MKNQKMDFCVFTDLKNLKNYLEFKKIFDLRARFYMELEQFHCNIRLQRKASQKEPSRKNLLRKLHCKQFLYLYS